MWNDWLQPGAALHPRSAYRAFSSQMPSHPAGWPCHRNALALQLAANLLHPGQLHAQHLPIQEQQCVECLPVVGRCHLLLGGERGEKAFDLCQSHLARVTKSTAAASHPQHKSQMTWPNRHMPSRSVGCNAGNEPVRAPDLAVDGPGRYPVRLAGPVIPAHTFSMMHYSIDFKHFFGRPCNFV